MSAMMLKFFLNLPNCERAQEFKGKIYIFSFQYSLPNPGRGRRTNTQIRMNSQTAKGGVVGRRFDISPLSV